MKQEKSEKIYDAITDIRDDLVEGAEKKPRRRRWWPAAVAAVVAVAVLGGVLLRPGGSPLVPTAYAIAEAQYPEMAPYPLEEEFIDSSGEVDWDAYNQAYSAWREDVRAQRRSAGYADGLEGFFTASIRQFLSGADGENKVYSPLNVYMALAMLAALTDGNSRQQILDLLGSGGIEDLRAQASDLWNANYIQDGVNFSVLASSLWLNEDVSFVQSTMDILAETYYASSYQMCISDSISTVSRESMPRSWKVLSAVISETSQSLRSAISFAIASKTMISYLRYFVFFGMGYQ